MEGIPGADHHGAEITGQYLFSDLYRTHPAAGFFWIGLVFLLITAVVAVKVTPLGSVLLLGVMAFLFYAALRDAKTPVVFVYSPTGISIRRGVEDIAASWSQAVVRQRPTAFIVGFRIPRGLGGTSAFVLPKRWMSQDQIAALSAHASSAGVLR